MRSQWYFVLALVALVCVVTVFVSPLGDLPFTALRSVQNARLLSQRLVAAATLPTLLAPVLIWYVSPPREQLLIQPGPELLALTCARLC